jgi:hypothetical protein
MNEFEDFDAGFHAADLAKDSLAKAAMIQPTPFSLRPASEIPPRQWLFGQHLIRGFLSLTVAPGGLGKSSMVLVEALAMATNKPLLGDKPPQPLRVWVWNGEDPREEIERRIAAACLHYNIPPDEIADRLMIDSGRDVPITLASAVNGGVMVAKPVSEALIAAIKACGVDVLIIDPFVTSHSVPENDTTAMNAVVAQWRMIADVTGCAIELVHHTSKAGAMNAEDFGVYASRGAGALIDGVRSARVLSRMREDEAERFGIEDAPASYFRVTMGKANLAPPEKATWRRMIGVKLGNGRDWWQDGDTVGVCLPWTPPDAFAGVSLNDLKRVQDAIKASEEAPKANERAADWAGYVIAEVMGLDVGNGLRKDDQTAAQRNARAKVRSLLGGWIKTHTLTVETMRSPRDGRDVKVIAVGDPVTAEDLAGAK